MRDINKIFEAYSTSITQLFSSNNDVFEVPNYQREYSWDKSHIKKIFNDIRLGVLELEEFKGEKSSLTFIGTVILIANSQGTLRSYQIVDGQQRITTILLICQVLAIRLTEFGKKLEEHNPNILKFVEFMRTKLHNIICGKYFEPPTSVSDFFPKLFRQDVDTCDVNFSEGEYHSEVATFIKAYYSHLHKPEFYKFQLDEWLSDSVRSISRNTKNTFRDNLYCIVNEVDATAKDDPEDGSETAYLPDLLKIKQEKEFKEGLFASTPMNDEFFNALAELSQDKDKKHDVDAFIRIYGFSNFLLNNVALTKLTITDEKYAYNIFESLNTAGEPLSAIETLKPYVTNAQQKRKIAWSESDSFEVFNNLEFYLDNFRSADEKEKESKELVINLAAMVHGRKIEKSLSSQSFYLRKEYEKIERGENQDRFIENLGKIIDFKQELWGKETVKNQRKRQFKVRSGSRVGEDYFNSDDEATFCMRFIIEMNTTTIIPILSRYFEKQGSMHKTNEFIAAVKATAAFLALWRGYFGNTQGIDAAFRAVLADHKLKATTDNDRPPLPSNELKKVYQKLWHKKTVSKNNKGNLKKSWISEVSKVPLYVNTKPLCRFLLFVSSHNTQSDNDNPHKLVVNNRVNNNFMKVDSWDADVYKTLEHVAPQSAQPSSKWDDVIYEQKLHNTIGNLLLMPQPQNAQLSNKPWLDKNKYFRLFAIEDIDEIRREAKNFDLKEETIKSIELGECLPFLKPISKLSDWDAEIIRERSESIASHVYDQLETWLNLPKS